jgi:hypothetical protein
MTTNYSTTRLPDYKITSAQSSVNSGPFQRVSMVEAA